MTVGPDCAGDEVGIFRVFRIFIHFSCSFSALAAAPAGGTLGHLRGAGIGDGYPFSPYLHSVICSRGL